MPELPEAERSRRLLEQYAVGRQIERVWCADDSIVFDDGPRATKRALTGRTVVAAKRRGKQIWCELDRAPHPLFHLGMTGGFRVAGVPPLKLRSSPKHEEPVWPPRFTKFRLFMEDGGEIVMTNARRLGRIRLRQDPEHEAPIARLGFDPIIDPPTPRAFVEKIRARKAPVKAVLMDQSFSAGVGNWIADEVLYQARIDPQRRANELTDSEARRIRQRLIAIVRTAIDRNGDQSTFPRTWLYHRRWGKDENAVTVEGHPIEFVVVGGRTTAWVPARCEVRAAEGERRGRR